MLAIQQILRNESLIIGSRLSDVKKIFFGDPRKIQDFNLPAIVIQPVRTTVNQRGSKYDTIVCNVAIKLVYNQKDFVREGTDLETVFAVLDSVRKMEEGISAVIEKNILLPYTDALLVTTNASKNTMITGTSYDFLTDRGFPSYEVSATLEAITMKDRTTGLAI
jgi:hypothetical protein